ncbi:Hypothetical predicted protein [Mytilus galloprovincialis]|uniref:Uncharacterized protein n=1 Tax=Mytilus galloprovincialis TaxID=29158 RepID=A0A8B6FZ45_MYTGA|nr:Hypothetical predicted protein [Mytilus galloprovincialis]
MDSDSDYADSNYQLTSHSELSLEFDFDDSPNEASCIVIDDTCTDSQIFTELLVVYITTHGQADGDAETQIPVPKISLRFVSSSDSDSEDLPHHKKQKKEQVTKIDNKETSTQTVCSGDFITNTVGILAIPLVKSEENNKSTQTLVTGTILSFSKFMFIE